MNNTIWKYDLMSVDLQVLEIPTGAGLMTVQMQHGEPKLWANVNPANPVEDITIEIFGTGHPMPDADRKYLGTFQTDGGLVFHVFARKA